VLVVEPAPSETSEQRAWVAWVRSLGSRGLRTIAIVCTHHHHDHVGGAGPIAAELELPLWAHQATAARLPGVGIARILEEGNRIRVDGSTPQEWEVLHTPGHAPGHVCLWEARERVLVLGDMIASEGTILIAPGEGDMTQYLEQLRRLEALDAKLGLPSHGEPMESPGGVLRRTHAHRLMREGKVLEAIAKGGARGAMVEDVLAEAYSDTPIAVWPIARLSLQAHVDKLVREERVVERGNRWCLVARC